MTDSTVATAVSATICVILLVILIITAILLYRQWRLNQEQKRIREERARRAQLENAFNPLPTISASVTPSMTSLYDSTDDTALVPASQRNPYVHAYDNAHTTHTHEDSVHMTSEPRAPVGGRRAQRVSYSKGNGSHVYNGHVTSSPKLEALPVAQSPTNQNPHTGYGSLGTDAMRYSYSSDQSHNTSFGSYVNHRDYTNPSRATHTNGAIPRDNRHTSHNTEV